MNERMDAEGQNGAKGMWRLISPDERSDVLWHKQVQHLSLIFFYMIYLTNLFESPFLHTNKRNKAKNQSNKKSP